MAARLSAFERARIEATGSAGAVALDIAVVLGRHPATVCRELGRCGGTEAVYDAAAAQADASAQARRPRAWELEADPVLAALVKARMTRRWSPHAISADMAAQGHRVCAETIYRAAYSGCGLGAEAWKGSAEGPASSSSAQPSQRKGRPAGGLSAIERAARCRRGAKRAGPLGRRPDHRGGQPQRGGHPGGARQPPRLGRRTAARLHGAQRRRRRHPGTGPPACPSSALADLGPRPRTRPLGRHRNRTQHQGVLLRAPQPKPTRHQRADQRAGATMAAQPNTAGPQPVATVGHRGQPQLDAPADSTTGNQPPTPTLNSLATTDRACPPVGGHRRGQRQ